MSDAPPPPSASPLESTALLLERARSGDAAARDALFDRVLPPLRRWARQRMPNAGRDLHDTDDLVQVTVLRAFQRLDAFESQGPGAFLGYVRHILLNVLRDELRRVSRRPAHGELTDTHADSQPPPLERLLGQQTLERYERALARLDATSREAVILRIELGFSHQEIADALARSSANAARMTVARAIVRLAEEMRDDA